MPSEFVSSSCEGKKTYATWKLARDIANRMSRYTHTSGESFEPYVCKVCHGVHIGRSNGKKYRRATKKKKDRE